jgi:hypothetical protein
MKNIVLQIFNFVFAILFINWGMQYVKIPLQNNLLQNPLSIIDFILITIIFVIALSLFYNEYIEKSVNEIIDYIFDIKEGVLVDSNDYIPLNEEDNQSENSCGSNSVETPNKNIIDSNNDIISENYNESKNDIISEGPCVAIPNSNKNDIISENYNENKNDNTSENDIIIDLQS